MAKPDDIRLDRIDDDLLELLSEATSLVADLRRVLADNERLRERVAILEAELRVLNEQA